MQHDYEQDCDPRPNGELMLQTLALPADTNQYGEIHGGWLAAKMDLAASIAGGRAAQGKVATVAIDNIAFLAPIRVGALVSCHAQVKGLGRSSIRIQVEAWLRANEPEEAWIKVAEGRFVFVAIDDHGRTRAIPREGALQGA